MFNKYQKITHLVIPNSVTILGNGYDAFRNMQGLTNIITNHSSFTDMSNMFRNCHNLTTAICPPQVTNMSNAYYYCNSI